MASHGAPLLARAKELAVLTEALRDAERGDPTVVTIDGPAGIGKSALVEAFATGAARGAQVFWLRCDRTERDIDFAAVELLLGAEVPTERGELGVARKLLSRLDDVKQRAGVSVLIIDDAHWMDLVSARSLRFALRRLQQDNLLTIVSQRPGFPNGTTFETADPAHTLQLQLAPLAAADVVTLARDLRRWRLALPLAERLVQLTGGIPLLLDLLLRCAADPTQLTSGDVPGSASSSTMRLLNSLDPDSRRLVEAAAVLGEPAEDDVLRTIGFDAEDGDPADGIAQAVGAGLLVGHRGALSIPHALLSQAVYDSLAPAQRRRLHQRAAQWTTGSRRLEHRASATETADPRLCAELVVAARSARSERRYAQAAVSTERARLLSSDAQQRDHLLLQAILDRVAAQDLRGAERLSTAARAMPPSALRGLVLGLLCREQGRVAEAGEHLQYAVEASLSSAPSLHQRAALALAVLQNRLYQGAAAAQTLAAVQADGDDPEVVCDIESNRAISLWQSGRPGAADALLADRTVSPRATAWEAELLAVRGMVRHYTGALSASLDDLDTSISWSSLWRPSTNQVRVYVVRSRTRFQLGDWDGAVADTEAAHAVASGQTELWNLPLVSAAAMLVPTWRGQWATAQRHLDEGKAAVSPSLWKGSLGAMVRLSELQLLEARGDRDQLLAHLQPMLTEQELESLSAFRSYLRIVPAWIEACLQAGRLADARQGLVRYEGLLLRWPGGPEAARIGLLRGLVAMADGDAQRARQHFAEDFADPQVRSRPFQLARLHHAAGRLEVLSGDHQAAVAHLSDAMAGFTRLGATPLQESCRADLGGIGAADVRPPPDRAWGLTVRESVVAAFVRRGFTNKEIAREMIVTVKAVEYHLTRIYAKAGVRGRHELRCALTAEPEPGAR